MNKVFVLVGKSASGKTTLMKGIQRLLHDVEVVVPFTTRGIRENEISGIDNVFITHEEMNGLVELGKVECLRKYYNAAEKRYNYYAIPTLEQTDNNSVKFLVTDLVGLNELKNKYGESVIGIYINRSYEDCYNSLLKRGDSIKEIERRLSADEKDYKNASQVCDYTINNDFSNDVLNKLKEIVQKEVKNI